MKKIISLLATVAMVSTLFVSVVKADFEPTVVTNKEKLSNADFNDLIGEDIPDGYDAYLVTIGFENLGDLNCEIKTKKHSGRKLQGFGYSMTFDVIDNVETDYVLSVDNVFGVDLSEGFDGSTFRSIFNAGSASAAYPTTAGTVTNAEGIEDAAMFVITVKNDATVVATLDTSIKVVTYAANTPGAEEQTNHASMSPSSLTFAPEAAPTVTNVASVSLNKSELTFTVGGAAQTLEETVLPGDADDKSVVWTSDDETVATVADGVVTPVGAGKATITVTTTDGGKTATCTVKVNPAPVASTGFKEIAKETSLSDLTGKPVDASKNYGVGRIETEVDTSKFVYKVVASDGTEEKEFDLPSGLEVAGNINFIAIVQSATHIIKSILLKAVVK